MRHRQDAAGDRVNIQLEGGGTLRVALNFAPLSQLVSRLLAALYAGLAAETITPLYAAILPFIGMPTLARWSQRNKQSAQRKLLNGCDKPVRAASGLSSSGYRNLSRLSCFVPGCNAALPAEEWADCSEQLLHWARAMIGGQPWVPSSPRHPAASQMPATGGSTDAAAGSAASAWDALVAADHQEDSRRQPAEQVADMQGLPDPHVSAPIWQVTSWTVSSACRMHPCLTLFLTCKRAHLRHDNSLHCCCWQQKCLLTPRRETVLLATARRRLWKRCTRCTRTASCTCCGRHSSATSAACWRL